MFPRGAIAGCPVGAAMLFWVMRAILPVGFGIAVLLLLSCGDKASGPDGPPAVQMDILSALPPDAREAAEKARTATKGLGATLRGKLSEAIAAGGAVGAIEVCQSLAPALAAEQSQAMGGTIRRVSFKVRNPDNEPADWEILILENFANRLRAGTDPMRLESAEVAEGPDGRRLLYARAITVEAACLTCHGEMIAPPIQAKLDTSYPDDHATGYREGDLRGIFSVVIPLPANSGG